VKPLAHKIFQILKGVLKIIKDKLNLSTHLSLLIQIYFKGILLEEI
jgi:hypothetical protein